MKPDPKNYFSDYDFTESSVIRIVHNAVLHQLEFVLAYADIKHVLDIIFDKQKRREARNSDAPWDFRRLMFHGITKLSRSHYTYKTGFKGFDPDNFNFLNPEVFSNACIQSVRVTGGNGRYKAMIYMGSLGCYHFEFEEMLADQRLVTTMPVSEDKSDHFDYYTGVEVEFYNPFPADYKIDAL